MEKHSAMHQYFAAFSVNLLTVAFGVAEGWSSPAVYLLTSDQSPLPSGKLSTEEASWFVSLTLLGCLFGNFLFAYAANKYGRKMPMLLMSVPIIMSWLLVLFSSNIYSLYVSRLLCGVFGGGGYTVASLFLTEIADDRLRGTLGSTVIIAENLGIMLAFIFGYFFDFYMIPKFVIGVTIAFAVLFYFVPESPLYLVKKNKILEAKKSIRYYKSLDEGIDSSLKVDSEITKLENTLNTETVKVSVTWSDFNSKPVIKAMTIGFVLVTLNQFCGMSAILGYGANIFEEAGSTVDPNISVIICGAILFVGTIVAMNLVDYLGRKMLFSISNIGTAIGLTTLGVFMMLKSWNYNVEAFNWIPLVSFSFAIFVAALGILTLPLVMLSELMPAKVKEFAVSVLMVQLFLFGFITLKYLPFLTEYSFHGSMFLFAGVCIAGELFIRFYVPETKGKSAEEIFKSLQ